MSFVSGGVTARSVAPGPWVRQMPHAAWRWGGVVVCRVGDAGDKARRGRVGEDKGTGAESELEGSIETLVWE